MPATVEDKQVALARLAELERAEAVLFAQRAVALVEVAELWSGPEDPAGPFVALDVAVTCQVAQVTASIRMSQAHRLVHELPRTLTGLQQHELTVGQALVLLKETEGLSPDLVGRLDRAIQPRIIGLTAGDTRRQVRKLLIELDALAAEARRRQQEATRRVWTSQRPDGRAFLGAELSAEQVGTAFRALTELTGAVLDPADDRTADQQRADLFSALPEFALAQLPAFGAFLTSRGEVVREGLTYGTPETIAARRARVQAVILIPVETALDLSDNPAELVGYGPVSGAHARELLTLAEVRKACVDAHTGRMLTLEPCFVPDPDGSYRQASRGTRAGKGTGSSKAKPRTTVAPVTALDRAAALAAVLAEMASTPSTLTDTPQPHHDPSRSLAELVRLRDPRCTGPGCSSPSRTCDLDHANPWPTGPTTADNLGPLSRRCHRAKTHSDWQIHPRPDGTITWTSPLGQTWTTSARHHPPDGGCYARPRVVWPVLLIETDEVTHRHAA